MPMAGSPLKDRHADVSRGQAAEKNGGKLRLHESPGVERSVSRLPHTDFFTADENVRSLPPFRVDQLSSQTFCRSISKV
jgi:hypothetical protein